jgi:hypothetical protein
MVVALPDDWGDAEMTAPRPESPGSKNIQSRTDNPADFDAELASLAMMKDLLKGTDAPSDITRTFAARKALFTALNHTEDNPTGYDASLRLLCYSSFEKSSLNITAKLFNALVAFLMKPKMIIQGMPNSPAQDNEPNIVQRIVGRLTGRGQPTTPQQGSQ